MRTYGFSSALIGAMAVAGSMYIAPLDAAPALTEHSVPTNLPGVRAFLPAPADFNPLVASAEALESYGFPPRPDVKTAPGAYASWVQAVTARTATIVPMLKLTNIYHGPARNLRSAPAERSVANATAVAASNWSGYAIDDSVNKPFAVELIRANFLVPVAQQALGSCTGSFDYGSAWVGIDGFSSSDVLQTGIEFDAYCANSTTETVYSAWYEWYPNPETQISNFPVNPGDDILVEVWNASATQGRVELINYTANVKVTLAFSAPTGTALTGDSIEWIVERPALSTTQLTTLTHYTAIAFNYDIAYDYKLTPKTNYYPNGAPTGTIYSITMLDDNNNPISYPVIGGLEDIWFYDEGSAR